MFRFHFTSEIAVVDLDDVLATFDVLEAEPGSASEMTAPPPPVSLQAPATAPIRKRSSSTGRGADISSLVSAEKERVELECKKLKLDCVLLEQKIELGKKKSYIECALLQNQIDLVNKKSDIECALLQNEIDLANKKSRLECSILEKKTCGK